MTETEKALDEVRRELFKVRNEVIALKHDFKECANELCLKCGDYHNEHLGACRDCRWLPRRHGDFSDII